MTLKKKNSRREEQDAVGMDQIAKSKLAHRVKLSKLPFPDKVKIIVELQKIDIELAKAAGRTPKKAWEI